MKPKISTGYLTPQAKKIKHVARDRLSDTEENTAESGIDENIFAALMKCPEKKKMILALLASNKEAIEKYKKNEAKSSALSPVGKLKNKRTACESPTALLRRRALEQMNTSSSTTSTSSQSEISRSSSRCSEISGDHSASPVPFNKVLKGVVAYVEIKNKDQDRSSGAKEILKSMGAKLKEKFTNDVTHVIFKDGSFTTYQKAKLMKIHLVSILWVEFCRKTMKRQPEKQYPALKSGFQDTETSMICSQMQKEYEDIIRDEYRRSIIEGTPLPSTRSLIDRRRTLMTPSVSNLKFSSTSSFQTAAGNISSQDLSDREVAAINGFQNSEVISEENLVLNDPECFSEVSGPMVNGCTVEKINSVSNSILKSVENVECSDMAAVNSSKSIIPINISSHRKRSRNDSDMELTPILNLNKTPKAKPAKGDLYSEKTPKLPAKKAPICLFDRRKTIGNSLLSSDLSITSLIASNKSNSVSSLISSDKSTNVSDNVSFAVPKSVKKSKRSSSSLFGSNESFQFGKNKAQCSKICGAEVDKTEYAMSELDVSSEKNTSRRSSEKKEREKSKFLTRRSRSMSRLWLSSEHNVNENLERSASMSDLRLSSEQPNKSKENSVPSRIEVTIETNDEIAGKSSMSALHVSSADNRKAADKPSRSSLRVSTEPKSSLDRNSSKKKNNSTLESDGSIMSSLHVSSEKVPNNARQISNTRQSNDGTFSSTNDSSLGAIKELVENVIETLQTPEFVTLRKKSDQQSASLSKKSIDSDDSEILSPRKSVRKTAIRRSVVGDNNYEDSSCTQDDDFTKVRELELLSSVTKRRRIFGSRGVKKGVTKIVQKDSPKEINKVLVVNIVKSPLKDNLQSDTDSLKKKETPPLNITRRRTLGQKRLGKSDLSKTPGKETSKRNDKESVENSTKSSSVDELNRKSTYFRPQIGGKDINKKKHKKNVSSTSDSDMEMDHSLNCKTTSDDSSDPITSRKKLRKLYNPDDSIPTCIINDEEEREQKRVAVKKRKSNEGVFINPAELLKSFNKRAQNDDQIECVESESDSDERTPPKRTKKGKKTDLKRVSLNSSADEQKELLNEVINKKNVPEVVTKTPKSVTKNKPKDKGKTPKGLTPSRRKSTRIIKSSQKVIDAKSSHIPLTPIKRRSTLDFQPVTSSKKPKKVDRTKLPTIVCTKLHKADVQVFAQIIKKLGRFNVEDEVSIRTTHLVAGEPKRTINMLRAISRGCWVLRFEWVLQSLEAGKWLREEDFEVHDFSPAVQKSRLERQAFGPTYTLDVFESCPPIYVAPNTNPRCSDLKELITVCRGKVVSTTRMAGIMVGEYLDQEDTVCVNETWILDCITFNKKVPFKQQYLLEKKSNKRKSVIV